MSPQPDTAWLIVVILFIFGICFTLDRDDPPKGMKKENKKRGTRQKGKSRPDHRA
jgi:hypothetical protein